MSIGALLSSFFSSFHGRANVTSMPEYDSFDSAFRASDSYEDPRLVQVVFEKTQIYRERLSRNKLEAVKDRQTLQNMFVMSYVHGSRPISVLEVGGACGAGYFQMQHLLPQRIEQWSIAETPAMAAAAGKLLADETLSFHTDCDAAANALKARDLAIAQGVLQYAPDPVQLLRQIFALDFDAVYVSRTVVLIPERGESARIFTQQNTPLSAHGPGGLPPNVLDGRSSQPMVLVDRDTLLSVVPPNYNLCFMFEESDEHPVIVRNRRRRLADIGFLATRI